MLNPQVLHSFLNDGVRITFLHSPLITPLTLELIKANSTLETDGNRLYETVVQSLVRIVSRAMLTACDRFRNDPKVNDADKIYQHFHHSEVGLKMSYIWMFSRSEFRCYTTHSQIYVFTTEIKTNERKIFTNSPQSHERLRKVSRTIMYNLTSDHVEFNERSCTISRMITYNCLTWPLLHNSPNLPPVSCFA